jgi:hypothetical protein
MSLTAEQFRPLQLLPSSRQRPAGCCGLGLRLAG